MKHTLLIVDDNDAILKVLRKLFEKKYLVYTAFDGVEAISFLSQGIMPDLIISDLNMRNINGYELVKHLATSVLYHEIPIIILSGYSEQDHERLQKQYDVVRIIKKPFDPMELLNFVEKILYESSYNNGYGNTGYNILNRLN